MQTVTAYGLPGSWIAGWLECSNATKNRLPSGARDACRDKTMENASNPHASTACCSLPKDQPPKVCWPCLSHVETNISGLIALLLQIARGEPVKASTLPFRGSRRTASSWIRSPLCLHSHSAQPRACRVEDKPSLLPIISWISSGTNLNTIEALLIHRVQFYSGPDLSMVFLLTLRLYAKQ